MLLGLGQMLNIFENTYIAKNLIICQSNLTNLIFLFILYYSKKNVNYEKMMLVALILTIF